tara:strand:- start:26571 stop:27584 length:1014 start_codon:yes stop_codon:yes gene_type:complete
LVNQKLKAISTVLTGLALLLAIGVIALGAYTRLMDAGLGCPDWPGCYGTILPPTTEEAVTVANEAFPERPVEIEKTWPEMIHRYMASSLGFLILVITIMSIINHRHPAQPAKLASSLLVLVILQGMLGMWTVTMKLYPPVVMSHLLGGFTILSVLSLLFYRLTQIFPPIKDSKADKLKWLAMLGVLTVIAQIMLGGWTAANYAAHICHDFPVCQPGWAESLNMAEAFKIFGHEVDDFEYAPHLSADAQMTIHAFHRIGAIAVTLVVGLLCVLLLKCETRRYKKFGGVVLLMLSLQLGLGIANVIYGIPLNIAVLHNLGGAMLLLVLVALNYSMRKKA